MNTGFLGILEELSEKPDAVTVQQLTGSVHAMKSIPANGKRWKQGEHPAVTDVTFRTDHKTATDLFLGEDSGKIAYIVMLPAKEFLEIMKEKGLLKEEAEEDTPR
jgi:hypothetical protein